MSRKLISYFGILFTAVLVLAVSAFVQTKNDKACCTVAEKTNCCAQPTDGGICTSICSAVCDPSACKVSASWDDPASNAEHTHQADDINETGADQLNGSIETIRSRYKVPALVAAVSGYSGLVAEGYSGVRAAGTASAIGANDKFHLGSCTKAVTATLAAILVDEGLLNLETTIGETFPELKSVISDKFENVTLSELLSHRAGIMQLERSKESKIWQQLAAINGTPTQQRVELTKIVLKEKPLAERGSKFYYTDLGYTIAGAMLERVTGVSFESLVQAKLANPLGITTIGFGAPGTDASVDQPRGHLLNADNLESLGTGPMGDLAAPIISPAGTVHMSIADWSKFAALHLGGTTSEGTRLINKETLGRLHDDIYQQGYALGWGISQVAWSSEKVYSHTGSCGAWSAAVWIVPEHGLAFVAASNYGGAEGFSAVSDALNLMIEKYIGPTEVATN